MEKSATPKDRISLQRMIVAEPPPYISAPSWVVTDGITGDVLFGRGETDKREIASLTKIMTAYTALQLIKKFNIDPPKTIVLVSEKASLLGGTTANLDQGDKLLLSDLMFGMMLPSGNDAAEAVAEYFGKVIRENTLPPIVVDPAQKQEIVKRPSCQKLFVNEMNRIAQDLNLTETYFVNPHGLTNFRNRSSASDISKLSSVAMANEEFRKIVKCGKHKCKGVNYQGEEKIYKWRNTNKLLGKGYNGVKTGITQSAGPCVATSIEKDNANLIVVILNSKTMDHRWIEVKKLTKWAISRLKKVNEISKNDALTERKKLLQTLVHL